jgi:tRNA threonylcarbamoyladenosine modification (KEOPS) complex Cgi121 subunit
MSRESCISHKPSTIMAIVKEDYCLLMGGDAVAAALLNLFEYWANAAIAQNPDDRAPNIGCHSISEFQRMLVRVSTDKQIRTRLKLLQEKGFIEIVAAKFGKSSSYRFFIDRVQEGLNNLGQTTAHLGQMTSVKQPRSTNDLGQTTDLPRSNNRPTSVKQPTEPRSNDRSSIYMKDQEEERRTKEEDPILFAGPNEVIEAHQAQLVLEVESFPLVKSDPGFTDETFGVFWSQTVMKVNREKARLAFLKVGKKVKGISFAFVLESWTQQQRRHMEEKGTVQYLRRAEAWLNGHCWEDCEDPFVQAGIKPEDVRRELKKAQLVAMLQQSNREKQETYA